MESQVVGKEKGEKENWGEEVRERGEVEKTNDANDTS